MCAKHTFFSPPLLKKCTHQHFFQNQKLLEHDCKEMGYNNIETLMKILKFLGNLLARLLLATHPKCMLSLVICNPFLPISGYATTLYFTYWQSIGKSTTMWINLLVKNPLLFLLFYKKKNQWNCIFGDDFL